VLGLFQSELRSVDISGQAVGFDGLLRIIRNMPVDMDRLDFDGARLDDGRRLVRILRQITQAPVRAVGWPEADAREALARAPDQAALQAELRTIKAEFERKSANRQDSRDAAAGEALAEAQPKFHAFAGQLRESSNRFRVVRLENEDFLAKFLDVRRDPIDLLYERVQQQTSVEAMLARLGL
jgi:hypothetical protein